MASNYRTLSAGATALLLSILMLGSILGCDGGGGPPPFTGGLRITALSQLSNGELRGVKGVFVNAGLLYIVGEGTGTATSLIGYTNNQGYIQDTNARTNAWWSAIVNFTPGLPACLYPIQTGDFFVPVEGAKINAVCII